MKWYGFVLIFLAATFFCDIIYTFRLLVFSETSLSVTDISLPDKELPILNRPNDAVLSARTMPKQPLVLFFLASWCRPCRLEAPSIMKLSERHDVPFIGIAVRDKEENLQRFLEQNGNPYSYIALDTDMVWTKAMNADKLPTAFVINAQGKAVAKINGIITDEFYFKTLLPFLQELKNEKPL